MSRPVNRRNLVKYGLATLGALSLGQWRVPAPFLDGSSEASAKSGPASSGSGTSTSGSQLFGYKPFSQPLFIPSVAQARPRGTLSPKPGQYERDVQLNGKPLTPRGNFNDMAHGIAPEYDGRVPGFPCPDWNRFSGHAHEVDQPTILKEYAARFGQFNGWYFLTGKESEIEQLRRAMGLYDLDPDRDADKTQHAGIVIAGNDTTNRWVSLPALMDHRQIAQTVLRITRNRETLDVKGKT